MLRPALDKYNTQSAIELIKQKQEQPYFIPYAAQERIISIMVLIDDTDNNRSNKNSSNHHPHKAPDHLLSRKLGPLFLRVFILRGRDAASPLIVFYLGGLMGAKVGKVPMQSYWWFQEEGSTTPT